MTEKELEESLNRLIKYARRQGFCLCGLSVLLVYFISDIIKKFL